MYYYVVPRPTLFISTNYALVRESIDTRYGSQNQTEKNELAWMGIESMTVGLALRRSDH